MESGPLQQDAFLEFAKKVVLFCHITSMVTSDPHQDLLGKKGGGGFPYLVFMDAEGNLLAQHQGDRSAAGFEQTMKTAAANQELKAKGDAGDKAAKAEFLLKQLEWGTCGLAEFDEKIKEAGELSKEHQARVDAARPNAEFKAILQSLEGVEDEAKAIADAGPKLADMKKGGRIPSGDQELSIFYSILLEYAFAQKDATLFEESLNALKEKFGANPNAKPFFEAQEQRLEELKGGK